MSNQDLPTHPSRNFPHIPLKNSSTETHFISLALASLVFWLSAPADVNFVAPFPIPIAPRKINLLCVKYLVFRHIFPDSAGAKLFFSVSMT